MIKTELSQDIEECLKILRKGGLILYPTDTIWGIGCDATNEAAIEKIYRLKKRDEKKSMIILVSGVEEIKRYVSQPSKKILDFLATHKKPVTAIFENGIHLPWLLINKDGTVAIRIVKDDFCKELISKSGTPLVSTSANVSGKKYPLNFEEISNEIKNGVDYVVQHRRDDFNEQQPSSLIKLNEAGEIETVR